MCFLNSLNKDNIFSWMKCTAFIFPTKSLVRTYKLPLAFGSFVRCDDPLFAKLIRLIRAKVSF